MPTEEYQQASQLFLQLLDVPEAERDSALDTACRGDERLRSAVLRLLAADSKSGEFLQRGAISDGALMLAATGDVDPAEPPVVAHYRMLAKLGQGGMGEVWRAYDTRLHREVAVKILPRAFAADRERMTRFAREARVLALLNHPNVASIHGVEEQALIIELVDGKPLPTYADEHHLDTRQRLELMAKVCDGVHHAHQRGVLHRDLKPANIIVVEPGQPKVLDFGVARLLDDETQTTRQTDLGQLIGTVDYMSPEQATGDPRGLDIRSDVYSLGVILYQLLAGRLPYETRHRPLTEVLRAIREDDPAPLSTVDPRYSGDIETIARKALEKDLERRYASAAELAADIRRYLNDQPIEAMPPGTRYRAGKFFRRHRVVVLSAAVSAMLVIGFGVAMAVLAARASIERDKAETERARADAIADFLRNDVLAQADIDAQSGGRFDPNLRMRDALDRAAVKIDGKFGKQPLVEAAVRQTIGETYSMLGVLPRAKVQLDRALAIRRQHLPVGHTDLLASLFRAGQLQRLLGTGDHGEALLREAVETGSRGPGEPDPEVFHAMGELAGTYMAMGKPDQAEVLYRRVLERRVRLSGPYHPISVSVTSDIAYSLDLQGKFAESVALYQKAVEYSRNDPRTIAPLANLGNLYVRLGEFDKAAEALAKARKVAEETQNEESRLRLNILDSVASLARDQGRFREAEALFRQAWGVRRRVLGENGRNTLTSVTALGDLACTAGNAAEGEKMLVETLKTQLRLFGDQDRFTQRTIESLTLCYLRQHKFQEAEPWAAKLLALRRSHLHTANPITRDAVMLLADIRLQNGGQAPPLIDEACATAATADWHDAYCTTLRGVSLSRERNFAKAEPLLVSGYEGMLAHRGHMPAGRLMHLASAKAELARLYEAWGKPEQAVRWK